jgi:hypothetical protein
MNEPRAAEIIGEMLRVRALMDALPPTICEVRAPSLEMFAGIPRAPESLSPWGGIPVRVDPAVPAGEAWLEMSDGTRKTIRFTPENTP